MSTICFIYTLLKKRMIGLEVLHFQNPFSIGHINLIYTLKMITVISKLLIFSHIHTKIHKFRFRLMDNFFQYLSTFSGFPSQSNLYSEDVFLIFRKTGLKIDFIYGLLLLSRTLKDSIDKSFYALDFFFCVYKNYKNKFNIKIEKHISLDTLNKTFTFSASHDDYPYPPL